MPELSFSRLISARAHSAPDEVVVIADDEVLTATELDRRSNRLARAYLGLGVRQDDLVAVALPNTAEFVIVCAAIWKAGATPMPMSPGLDSGEQAAIEDLARPALVVGRRPATPSIVWARKGFVPDEDLPDDELPDSWASCWKAPTSSGSTGVPKVVRAAAPALADPTRPVAAFLPREAVQLVSGPIWHSASFTYAFRGLLSGHALVILPGFDESRVLAAIPEYGVTWMLLSPTMIHRLMRVPADDRDRVDVSSLETVLHMGAPCAPADKRALIQWVGPHRVVEVYAGSESNGLTMIRGDDWLDHPGSVGRPIGGTELKILRRDGSSAAPREIGEVWMRRGPDPTYSYVGRQSRRTADGWDSLGDAGFLDADGHLTIIDRVADLIVSDGVDIYPAEIERVLEGHPLVRGAVAYGVPDAWLGQIIEAVVDVAGAAVDEADLRALVGDELDQLRVPRRIRIQHDPVRSDAGKVRRPRNLTR